MTKSGIKTTLFFSLALVLFTGCDSSEPDDDAGENELITEVTLLLTDPTGASVRAVASDPDGDGVDITVDTLTIEAGVVYNGSIQFEDTVNGEDITEEVEEEADEHQVFYIWSSELENRGTVTYGDVDGNNLPLGLRYQVQVSGAAAATGTLNVVLSHYDDGPKNGTDRSDESDVDIVFPVVVTEAQPN